MRWTWPPTSSARARVRGWCAILQYDRQVVLQISAASQTPNYAKGFFAVMANACRPTCKEKPRRKSSARCIGCDEPVGSAELAKAKKQAAELIFGMETVNRRPITWAAILSRPATFQFEKTYVENIQK